MAATLGGCHFCLLMVGFGIKFMILLVNEARWRLFPRKISPEEVRFLDAYFPYFSHLKPQFRAEFLEKLETILSTKRFIARGGLEKITSQMEVLIGATIAMVVFGWRSVRLTHFHTILVYPNVYYSTINRVYHRGEVNPRHGLLVLSWNCFVEGMEDHRDGVNVGIHEIAHALKLSHFIAIDGKQEFHPKAWAEYNQWVPAELDRLKKGLSSLFRESAGWNEHEFFAVALENFFERSQELKNYHPKLYQALVNLLRQDPLVLRNVP
jgi:Mlc titration factor MtfA (ptsG expression regulator)